MFKKGDIVYCIDKTTMYTNTRSSSLLLLILNNPYTIVNPNGGGGDISLKENGGDIYYNNKRFISEMEYKIRQRKDKILKIKKRIWQRGEQKVDHTKIY